MDVSVSSPTKPIKVLFAITKGNWGGAQKYVYDLATEAKNKGFTVGVIYGTRGPLTQKLDEFGIETIPLPETGRDVRLLRDFQALVAFVRILRKYRPDVLHLNSSKIGGIGALAGRIARVPKIVFTAHGWAFNENRPTWQKKIIWLTHYLTVLLCHTTICVSEAMRRDAKKMHAVQNRFVVIHNGIRATSLLSRKEAREKLLPAVTSSHVWIGTIAELHPTKNLNVLIRAFSKIPHRAESLALIIMGEGESRIELETLAKELHIAEKVWFLGHIPNASEYLPALDIFTLPSRSEGLAYVLLEAGLASLPVIATRVGGIPEVIQNTVTGLLVPPGEPTPLKEALVKILDDRELGSALGAALHERVVSDFSLEEMVSKTLLQYL